MPATDVPDEPDDRADLPPRIGPYRLLSRLGTGGLCEVFLAEAYGASGFVRRVAVKRLHESLSGEAELTRALIREAQLGGMLRHRGLVQIQGLGIERPFDREGVLATMQAISDADLTTWPRLAQLAERERQPETAELLITCLARQPEARFASMAALRARLPELGHAAELAEVATWVSAARLAEG